MKTNNLMASYSRSIDVLVPLQSLLNLICEKPMKFVDSIILVATSKPEKTFPRRHFGLRTIAACLIMGMAGAASAAPVVLQASGTFSHKGTTTISGSGFGTKAAAAPLVWDDASGTNILNKWDGAWPNRSSNTTNNTAYRTPIRGIGLPHSHITKYIAGSGAENSGYDAGWNIVFWKNTATKPSYIYASWYERADDAWVFGGDNNFKRFAYSVCCSPYEMPNNWYESMTPSSRTDTPGWMINDDGTSMSNPDVSGHNFWWNDGGNPMNAWTKIETAVHISSGSDGYIKVWDSGKLVVNYTGPTDKYAGSSRSIGIGGYIRMSGQPNNWRYFADAYVDTTLARVVLANNAVLAAATIVETQIPSSWSNTSINISVNLGKFTSGQTAYLFVVDSSGAPSAAGIPVTVGGTAAATTLTPPTNVHVM